MHHHKEDFDYDRISEFRKKYMDTEKIFRFFKVNENDVLADLGCGDGYYSLEFSKRAGKVIAIDTSKKACEIVRNKIYQNKINNISVLCEDVCKTENMNGANIVFMSTSFHDFPCREFLPEIFQKMKVKKAYLIEFKKGIEIGPPDEIKISQEELDRIFSRGKYIRRESMELQYHYLSIYEHGD
ncbi:class I SAM-dependent methyltransferase [Cuniculiplasmataceae archaeon SKW2]